MSKQGKNKCHRVGAMSLAQPWFKARVKKQRRRNKIAKRSRHANRGRK